MAYAVHLDLADRRTVEKMNSGQNSSHIIESGEATFAAEVLRSPQPVLVAFCAPWSRPCRVMDSVLQEIAAECARSLKLVRVDADENPEISVWYGVQSIPTLLFFVAGEVRARLVGTASKAAILSKIQAVSQRGETEFPTASRDKST